MPLTEIGQLEVDLAKFASDRDWHQFNTSKNLAISICLEANELMQSFQWENDNLSWKNCPNGLHDQLSSEVADVFIYLLQFCDKMGIDLIKSTRIKMAINAARYPIEKAKGNCKKAEEL
jgi:dCTP diphosphatase